MDCWKNGTEAMKKLQDKIQQLEEMMLSFQLAFYFIAEEIYRI